MSRCLLVRFLLGADEDGKMFYSFELCAYAHTHTHTWRLYYPIFIARLNIKRNTFAFSNRWVAHSLSVSSFVASGLSHFSGVELIRHCDPVNNNKRRSLHGNANCRFHSDSSLNNFLNPYLKAFRVQLD